MWGVGKSDGNSQVYSGLVSFTLLLYSSHNYLWLLRETEREGSLGNI